MQPKAALRNGQPAPAQARSGWIMPFVFRTAGPSSQLIWTAVFLKRLRKSKGGRPKNCGNALPQLSEYKQALEDTGTPARTARYWQELAEVPLERVQKY